MTIDNLCESQLLAHIVDVEKRKKVIKFCIDIGENLGAAFRRMDQIDKKLLIVVESERFASLISAGDIQRALVAGTSISSPVRNALRKKVRVASPDSDREEIRTTMISYRTEFMPVVDANGSLYDVIFWEDMIAERFRVHTNKVTIPAVIMAGGRGTRLRPITNIIPKPLLPIGERPILEVIMDSFYESGVHEFYVSVNYKAEMIRDYFAELSKPYVIQYSAESRPLGTAGSLAMLKNHLQTSFFVSNCDILIDQEYQDVFYYHRDHRCDLTVVAALKSYPIPYGTIDTGDDGMLRTLIEKPTLNVLANTGVYVLEPHLLREIPDDTPLHITELIMGIRQRGGRVGVFPISEGAWLDIGDWPEYHKNQEQFRRRSAWSFLGR